MGPEPEQGRPAETKGRAEAEIRTYDFLDSLGIKYERADHEAAFTMEACEEIDAVLGIKMCKNLFLCNRQETSFYLLMMPGDLPFKTKDLSAQIGSARLSFASHDKMKEYLDITPGAMSVMGLMNDTEQKVQLLIEESILQDEYLGCHPCVNTSSLKIRMKDITEIFLPAVSHSATIVRLTG
ncbi:MAG: prolyl-tRNA synthetase associated domain-containing protein [Lachnospiraceae bacterium]|nr:prolyl-tRNA synthetase associated domain-containing protein [Lachnospiraceae bacterium]